MIIQVVAVGRVQADVLRALSSSIIEAYKPLVKDCQVIKTLKIPSFAYDTERKQHRADAVLKHVHDQTPAHGQEKIFVITNEDLYAPGLNFVFGQAQCPGAVAVMSLCRLYPTFYGQKTDRELLLERATKEAVHELGHTLGLRHCTNPECVMSFSNSIIDVDRKKQTFCETCRGRLGL
ncbi:MAG: archaemetzincin family Zn-dependent metalloprotease [Candidatus Hadarchaeota archaeon]|nr:archaemetzincin family Zn-dependent metalloprotease [Candidatus Hadarchaeota archaeon]